MNDEYTSTSGSSSVSPPLETKFTVPLEQIDATVGGTAPFARKVGSHITENARRETARIPDRVVAQEANEVLAAIERTAQYLALSGQEIQNLPPVMLFAQEDGSVTIEWPSVDYRLGFTIEANPDESGWYLTTSERLGEAGSYGYLSQIDVRFLAYLLVNFIVANS